jgi:hypothetical protein
MQLHRRALSGVTALVLLATSWLGTSLAHAEPIDTSSRQEVAEAYNARLLPTLTAKPKWTGSVKKCTKRPKAQPKKAVGTDSAASKKATIQAVNYFREMAGLSPVKEDVKLSALALYMDDYGDHNKPVGHRVWMLRPETSKMGTGSTDNTNALYVDSEEDSHNANPRPDGGVAWPSKGYFPWETMPTSKRWSFSLAPRYVEEEVEPGLWRIGYDGELFGKAKVTMTKNGKTVKTKVISRAWAAADPTLVWETTKKLTKPKPGKTDTYKVTISGVKGHADVAYSVKVFMASYKAFSTAPKPTISGTAQVGKKLTANPGAWKPSSAKLSYQWYRGSSKIAGATEKTYTPTKADKGRTVKVKVTAKKSGYTTTSKFSATRKVT